MAQETAEVTARPRDHRPHPQHGSRQSHLGCGTHSGELLKLGIRVSKHSIQRHILAVRPFLKNHTVWACDFLQVHDVWFRPLFSFFVVDVNTKEVVHVAITREPSQAWTAQQLRQLAPFAQGPDFIIRDRDSKFGAAFDRVAEGAGIRVIKTAVRAPLMHFTCERFLGSVRRECLDHVIILGDPHLRSVLDEYVAYFNSARPHQGLQQTIPAAASEETLVPAGNVVAFPVVTPINADERAGRTLRLFLLIVSLIPPSL